MKNNKWDYFLNAMYYCIWLMDKKIDKCLWRIMDTLFIPPAKLIFTKSFQKKLVDRRRKNRKELNSFLYDRKNGYHIGWANYMFGYIYSGYPGFISCIFVGMAIKILNNYNFGLIMILIAIPIGLAYIPAYKAVFSNDRYLKYFKEFETEGKYWHKKWKRRTIVFCIGSFFAGAIGIGTIFAINILWGVL